MIENLTIADFECLEGETVDLLFDDQIVPAEVLSATPGTHSTPGSRHPFSVILRAGPPDKHQPQGTYGLNHPQHGQLQLFMVPIGPDEQGMRYEISFS